MKYIYRQSKITFFLTSVKQKRILTRIRNILQKQRKVHPKRESIWLEMFSLDACTIHIVYIVYGVVHVNSIQTHVYQL